MQIKKNNIFMSFCSRADDRPPQNGNLRFKTPQQTNYKSKVKTKEKSEQKKTQTINIQKFIISQPEKAYRNSKHNQQ